jgi:hypothetical protein
MQKIEQEPSVLRRGVQGKTVLTVFAFVAFILLPVCVSADGATVFPANPTTNDEVVVRLESEYGWIAWQVMAAFRDGNELHILLENFCPFPPCGGGAPYFFDVGFGQLPAGTYSFHIPVLSDQPADLVVTQAEPEIVPARVDLAISPPVPSDNDRVHAVIPIQLRSCEEPEISGLEQIGTMHRVHVDLPVEDAESACGERLVSLTADLGQLAAGVQTVQVLTRVGDGQQTQSAMETFVVADGPDAVTVLDRYRVSIDWTTPDGETGDARPVALSSDASALFTFFDPSNWEVLVKVLDGCAINGHRWVFLAAATDVEFELKVEDLQGATEPYLYRSVAGSLTPPLTDTGAIPCIP